jgi:hypothetical protein
MDLHGLASSPPIKIGVTRRRPPTRNPRFSTIQIIVGIFANAEERYKDDVVIISFGFVMQYRPFSFRRRDKRDEACSIVNRTLNGASQQMMPYALPPVQ